MPAQRVTRIAHADEPGMARHRHPAVVDLDAFMVLVHGDRLADQTLGHGVAVGVDADEAVQVHHPIEHLVDRRQHGRQLPDVGLFHHARRLGRHAQRALGFGIGHLDAPAQRLRVQVLEAGEGSAHHQAGLVRDDDGGLDAELVGLARLALADALHLGGVQRVELVLVLRLLRADALGAPQPHRQIAQRLGVEGRKRRRLELAPHLAHDDSQGRALALDDLLQATELLGVRIAAGPAPQLLALFGEGLLELNACALGGTDDLVVVRDLEQAAVHGVRDGFLLHRGVDNHSLQLGGLDGLDGHSGVDGGLQEFLQAVFAQRAAEAPDLGRVAGQPVLVVVQTAEGLPQDVLAPAGTELLVAEVEAILEVDQAGHQPNGQPGAPANADAPANDHRRRAEEVSPIQTLTRATLTLELGCHRRLDQIPWQALGEHRQRIVQLDHGVDAAAKEVRRLHARFPQESTPRITLPERNCAPRLPRCASIHAGSRAFAGSTG
jgi:hypothetical protein